MRNPPAVEDIIIDGKSFRYVPIGHIEGIERLPFSLRIILENLCRQHANGADTSEKIQNLLNRKRGSSLSIYPTRIFGQDILGQVMLIDIAALRDAVAERGGDPEKVSPRVPIDVVIDHSLQVDHWATPDAARLNLKREYERNGERFAFLRWCSASFDNVRIVPPGKGIMHQIHLEKIGQVVWEDASHDGHGAMLSPDTCVGTDSHTPMINGLGILGWGVGGIEAEATMLGKAITIALPDVVGVRVTGRLPHGTTPTDLVLTITRELRAVGVVDKFVEFFGPGVDVLSVGERGTISNMAPEYGATAVYFPIDHLTMDYLKMTGRSQAQLSKIKAYAQAQRLWRDAHMPPAEYDQIIEIDLSTINPCIAGPRNPEDYIDLQHAPIAFAAHNRELSVRPSLLENVSVSGEDYEISDGDVVIAAITSCTNTSSLMGMVTAGLVAKNAASKGLKPKPWVKTSFAPGSHAVAAILKHAGLQDHLDQLGFNVIGFGCTTCNGGSGPLPQNIAEAIEENKLVSTAVLSGNRNFQGRIHPNVRAAYLASPALVIAYAIAGTMQSNVALDPLGFGTHGQPVYLSDIWPGTEDVTRLIKECCNPSVYTSKYDRLWVGDENWDALAMPKSRHFQWAENSTYVKRPPYFDAETALGHTPLDLVEMRPLCILGDSITTDHISPSGAISLGSPAADFLLSKDVEQRDFNNYTTRRGNHEVAIRATFANIRLRNHMVPGMEGGLTRLQPGGEVTRIFDAAQDYRSRGVRTCIIAGHNYGSGSSRDWAAKGVALLGVKTVIAQSFERIHRTNLIGMGVLPLQFQDGVSWQGLRLDGTETYTIMAAFDEIGLRTLVPCVINRADGSQTPINLIARLDTEEEVNSWRNGGIFPTVLREFLGQEMGPQ